MLANAAHADSFISAPAIFNTLENRQLYLTDTVESTQAFKRLMQGLISKNPKNLTRHVQYIHGLLAYAPGDADAIFSALLDLFIVLENRGLALRRRMLMLAKPHLLQGNFKFLAKNLGSGINKNSCLPSGYYAMLSAACTGRLDFISKQQHSPNAFASAYEEAVSLLEYGELEQAQGLLEQALKEQPQNETIAQELVAVYTHHNDEQAQAQMSQWFMTNNLALPECWPML